MCTLIVLDRVVPDLPLVVASNRDEYLTRPAAPPTRIESQEPGQPPFVAPQDLEAGGTWMGLNAHGLFAGLTNRPTEARAPDRRSRGLLVLDALRRTRASDAAADLRAVGSGSYNPFNLLCADGRETWVGSLREDGMSVFPLEPGCHVLCNRDVNDPEVEKVARTRRELAQLDLEAPLERLLGGLARILASHSHDAQPLEQVCVHTPSYGTRSSALWAVERNRARLWYADGPPCETKYRNFTRLLDGFQQAP